MLSQIPCLNKCEITLAAFVWPFPGVCFQMSPQIACMNPHWLHLIFLHYNVFPNVSSLWEYFDLQGPWRKVLTDLKKSLYTLQADPEKSRDFMLKNPGILIDWKSRDPVRAWWWYRSFTEYWSWCAGELWSCWRQYMLLEHWEVTVVIEMVVGE